MSILAAKSVCTSMVFPQDTFPKGKITGPIAKNFVKMFEERKAGHSWGRGHSGYMRRKTLLMLPIDFALQLFPEVGSGNGTQGRLRQADFPS